MSNQPIDRQCVSTGVRWEEEVGYSRAVRVGSQIFVTGTLAVSESGDLLAPGDPYQQTLLAIDRIAWAIEQCGGSLGDVVRTRMYITRMEDAEHVGRAHRERLGEIKPCATMVQVAGLFAGAAVEIEADAVLNATRPRES